MDIDDLLAEVSADAVPQETRDLQELTRTWVAERVAPEILPWPEALMHRVNERILKQVRLPSAIPSPARACTGGYRDVTGSRVLTP
jgi:hypothetical protein